MPRLLPLIPEHTAYVEVFGGAAALLLNKPPSRIDVYNDLDGELVNLFEVIRDNADAFLRRADFLLYSRELYQCWQSDLEEGRRAQDPVERAVRFWYVVRSAFGAHPDKGWAFQRARPRNSATVIQNALVNIRAIHERLKSVEIDHLDFRRCVRNRDAPTTFMFLDPPYLETEEYRVGTFTLQDHCDLAQILHKAESKWLLTVGDHPVIRKIYKDFHRIVLKSSISCQKVIGSRRRSLRNLVIRNYEPPREPLYTGAASQMSLMDLFGIEVPAERRAALPLQAP